jgi:hypothetical protein
MTLRMLPALLLALPLAATPCAAAPASKPAQVTVYRCTDAAGRLSLRDSPCRRGETQQVRAMLRPTDPPPQRRVATASRGGAPRALVDAGAAPRVVYVTPPRPLYECTTPDGARYTSESGEGHPRWVPLWTLGYPVAVVPEVSGGYGASIDHRRGDTRVRIDAGRRWRMPGGSVVGPASAYAPAGIWLRDTCHALPAAEVCARLADARERGDRRYHSALQGEREAIVREQRLIDARLASECRA